jgi:putative ABC transport system permease protein
VLGRTFLELLNADLGFHPAHVATLNVSLDGTRHRGRSIWQYYSQVLQRLRSMPGVEAAGAATYLPLQSYIYMANGFKLNSGQTVNAVWVNAVTPGYFRAMGTGFVAGHDFTKALRQSSPTPVIVNEAFAHAAGLGKRIAGRKLRESRGNHTLHPIVGVVDTMRAGGPANPGQPEVYFPLGRELPHQITFVAKVRGEEAGYLARLRDAAAGVDPQVPVYDVKTLDQRLAGVLARPRFYTLATGFLAALAVLLAAIGIYGTAAYAIAQRRHEMGVRMALGASHLHLRGRLLRESMTPAAIGAAAGIALSLASGRYLQHLLAHAELPAVWTCAIAAGFLLLIGFIAAWNATANLLSIDPGDALRVE